MAKDAEQVMDDILALPEAAQRDIVKRLLRIHYADAPLESEEEAEILDSWLDEAERRLAAYRAGTEETVSWEEMKREFGTY